MKRKSIEPHEKIVALNNVRAILKNEGLDPDLKAMHQFPSAEQLEALQEVIKLKLDETRDKKIISKKIEELDYFWVIYISNAEKADTVEEANQWYKKAEELKSYIRDYSAPRSRVRV